MSSSKKHLIFLLLYLYLTYMSSRSLVNTLDENLFKIIYFRVLLSVWEHQANRWATEPQPRLGQTKCVVMGKGQVAVCITQRANQISSSDRCFIFLKSSDFKYHFQVVAVCHALCLNFQVMSSIFKLIFKVAILLPLHHQLYPTVECFVEHYQLVKVHSIEMAWPRQLRIWIGLRVITGLISNDIIDTRKEIFPVLSDLTSQRVWTTALLNELSTWPPHVLLHVVILKGHPFVFVYARINWCGVLHICV